MKGKHKSYGYEGGYEDWTADKVFKNMRIMQDGKQVADVEETEDVGLSAGDRSYSQRVADRNREWDENYKEMNRPTSTADREEW